MAYWYDSLECLCQQLGVLSQVCCELLLQKFLLLLQLDILQQLLRGRGETATETCHAVRTTDGVVTCFVMAVAAVLLT